MSGAAKSPDLEALVLFEEALERSSEERELLLTERTEGRPELRAEVEALLALESRGIEMPQVVATPDDLPARYHDTPELAPGTTVGSSTIIRPIGVGGMGRVYLALQESPRRRVALKTLLRHSVSEHAWRRFQVEGELLGHLRHPGIAQVFETGVQRVSVEGRELELPFITMELLEGPRSIVDHAREEGLSLEERVRLVVEVARAVHHAHQKGVIHRDLKPANLPVDAGGRARVIDFGIARATELELSTDSVHTLAGQLLGTPGYMSPEQLTLPGHELDTRTDVYALGAVAYELLCGRAPFPSAGRPLPALVRDIVDRGPERPRAVAPVLPRDLEAILLRAMASDREDRYSSAAALADDLERFLNHETVEAQRTTLLHQLRLFSRRHKLFAASVVVSGLSLLVATGVSGLFAVEAREAERLERAERERADVLLTDTFEQNLRLVFDFAEKAGHLRGGGELRNQMLTAAGERLAELEEEARREPGLLALVARAYVRLGDALGAFDQPNAGDLEGAAAAYGRAELLLDEVGTDDPRLARALMDLEQALGDRARASTDFPAALEHYERAIAVGEDALALRPDDDGLRSDLLRRRRDLGNTLGSMKDHEGALKAFEGVVAGWQEMLERYPGDVTTRHRLATAHSSVASATIYAVGAEESLERFRLCVEQLEAIASDHPDYQPAAAALVGVRHAYTEALIQAGRFTEAVEEARAGIELARELQSSDPGDVQLERWRGLLHYNAGWGLERRAETAREEGAAARAVRDDLDAAVEELSLALEVFEGLRDTGRLLPFEQGHIRAIQEKIERIGD